MRKFLVVILIAASLFISAEQIDINNENIDAIDSLLIPDEVINNIKIYMKTHGSISSIYELRALDGVDSELFEVIKSNITVKPDTSTDSLSIFIIRMQERLASEESPTEGALDLWEELLINKMNINKVDANDLLLIDGVNLTDAAAILDARKKNKRFRYPNDVRRSQNLTYFAWSRLRNYIGFEDYNKTFDFSGYFRTKLRYTNDDTYNYSSMKALTDELAYRMTQLEVAHPESVNVRTSLLEAGYTNEQVDSIGKRVSREYDEMLNRETDGDIINKTNIYLGKYLSCGGLFSKYSGIESYRIKGFASIKNLPFIDQLIIGNYRVTLGQGLIMDNTDEYRSRKSELTQGLFSDLTESYATKFTGAALSGKASVVNYILFGSKTKRNAVLNLDGTVNVPILSRTEITDFEENYEEVTAGGRIGIELGGILNMPTVTEIGFSGYNAKYDRNFRNDTSMIDIPFDKDNLSVPVYLKQFTGDIRRVLGMDFRTTIKNLSIEGEAGMQDSSYAYIVKSMLNFDNFYLKALFRHYDVGFDNPYARPFSEQARFDDTVLEKSYRLVDPLFTFILDDPRPKSEEGIYFETRYRITEKVTFNYCYIDIWKTLDYNMYNYRVQGEIEVRPVFPVRVRLKHKIQEKNIYKSIVSTHSMTNETSLRIFALLENDDYINFEARYGMVNLTTTEKYAANYFIDGSFLSGSYEHKISQYFSVLGGFAVWETDGMSQWIFDDNSIDFLYGDGNKVYLTFIDRISDYMSVRMKLSLKNQEVNHAGINTLSDQLRYSDSDYMTISDFVDYSNILGINIQMDIRW